MSNKKNHAAALLPALTVLTLLISCKCDVDAPATLNITGHASAQYAIPSTNSTGWAAVTGTYHTDTKKLAYTCKWGGLTATPVAGGLHTGAPGVEGTLYGNAWIFDANSLSTSKRHEIIMLDDSAVTALLNGNLYFTLTTITGGSEEIRGQINAAK